MFKWRKEAVIAVILLLITLSACSLSKNNEAQKPIVVSKSNIVREPVTVSENIKSDKKLECSVTRAWANDKSTWIRMGGAGIQFKYLNIIEQDTSGRMWLATDGIGLIMYDGEDWHQWTPNSRDDMRGNALRTMAVSNTNVYVGTYGSSDGGNLLVYNIKNDHWYTISPRRNALRSNVIGGVAVNQTGQVYVMTKDGLDILNKGTWMHLNNSLETGLILYTVEDALFDNAGNYWVAASNGIWKFDGTTWISYTTENGQLPSNAVNALAIDKDERIWAATTSGLAVFSNNKWFTFSPEEFPWYQGWLDNVVIDSQNRVWVVSNNVLSIYNGVEAVLISPSSIGEDLWDNSIGFDKDGCAWVGVSDGLTIFRGELDLAPGKYEFLK